MYSPAQTHQRDAQQLHSPSALALHRTWEGGGKAALSCVGSSNHVGRKEELIFRLSPCFMSHPVRSAPCQNSTSPVKLLFPFPNRLLRAVPIPRKIIDEPHHYGESFFLFIVPPAAEAPGGRGASFRYLFDRIARVSIRMRPRQAHKMHKFRKRIPSARRAPSIGQGSAQLPPSGHRCHWLPTGMRWLWPQKCKHCTGFTA